MYSLFVFTQFSFGSVLKICISWYIFYTFTFFVCTKKKCISWCILYIYLLVYDEQNVFLGVYTVIYWSVWAKCISWCIFDTFIYCSVPHTVYLLYMFLRLLTTASATSNLSTFLCSTQYNYCFVFIILSVGVWVYQLVYPGLLFVFVHSCRLTRPSISFTSSPRLIIVFIGRSLGISRSLALPHVVTFTL